MEINPEFSLEMQMSRLRLSCFRHNIKRHHSLEKSIMLGKAKEERENRTTSSKKMNASVEDLKY